MCDLDHKIEREHKMAWVATYNCNLNTEVRTQKPAGFVRKKGTHYLPTHT